MKHNFESFCKDYEKIENYDKALKDNFKGWNCHHRKGIDIPKEELKALGMYYNRPASELIFLTRSEHSSLHGEGKHHSEESKKKISEAHKGKQGYWKGKNLPEEVKKKISEAKKGNKHALGCKRSEETRKKISEAEKGKYVSEETRRKLSEAAKGNTSVRGKRWFNNGKINVRAKECPDGFVPGRIKKL